MNTYTYRKKEFLDFTGDEFESLSVCNIIKFFFSLTVYVCGMVSVSVTRNTKFFL